LGTQNLYHLSVYLVLSFALVVFILLFFISAPYGKFSRPGWGPALKSKWAWMIMEFPSPALVVVFFLTSESKNLTTILFVSAWLAHYILRTFIYPFRKPGRNKSFPVLLVGMAFFFNCLNGFINGYGVFHLRSYHASWLLSWQFILGLLFFIAGFAINKTADEKFKLLRKENPAEYAFPAGWLFKYISCPHYFGEIIEWGGWALMTWSLPGFAFFVFTFANLFPRAIASHKWYRSHFTDYPDTRKAVIPFVV
jgi:3-oxo-5-alpha-steroid 4-dehydrogenase 1